jgi:phenylpropionate dioxygenase-like ring-hydroxylating dioxygenase large terminal subunit
MIPRQWYAVLDSGEVPRGRPLGVFRMGEKLVFWRDASGKVVCQKDLCPHRGAAVSRGKIRDDTIVCPFHGFRYDPTGECRLVPCSGRNSTPPKVLHLPGYPVREEYGWIWIFWGESDGNLPPVPYFPNLNSSFSYATFPYRWKTHYSRAIENQLDVMHLPFVHYNTIGRGNRTIVDGPFAVLEGDTIRLWVFNRKEDGIPARRPGELPPPEYDPLLYFRFPNVWENNIAPDFKIVAAFAPVDDGNTILYLRVYQRFIRIPLIRDLINALSLAGSLYIAWQDKVVVETQRPQRSDLQMGEHPVPGDGPILLYRRHRRALLDSAGSPATS